MTCSPRIPDWREVHKLVATYRVGVAVMEVLLLTTDPAGGVLPALALLDHRVRTLAPTLAAMLDAGPYDVVLVDARGDLVAARGLCRLLSTTGVSAPVVAVLTGAGLLEVATNWMVDDILLPGAGPAEIDVRLRLLASRATPAPGAGGGVVSGELMIDESTYTCWLGGRALELTYKEFELLRYLARHPGRVFNREQLLREIWGEDFYGGPRTVDVHIRRLRAKLGPEHDQRIGTVRNVGYKLVRPAPSSKRDTHQAAARSRGDHPANPRGA